MSETTDTSPEPLRVVSPPGRLHEALEGVVVNDNLKDYETGKIIAMVMKHEQIDVRASWYAAHGELLELLAAAEEFVRQQTKDYDKSPHARTFLTLSTHILEMDLSKPWHFYAPELKTLVTVALPYSVFEARADVTPIAESDVSEVLAGLEQLIKHVQTSEYPADFQTELLEVLLTLKDRIYRFEILGPEGVKKATAAVVGTLTINEHVAKSSPEVIRDAADLVSKVADVFLKTYAVGRLIGPALKQLLSGS